MSSCKERHRLLEAYNVATIAYAEAVGLESDMLGKASIDERLALKEATQLARQACTDAKLELARHIANHQC